jgi:hypothetical protein
MDENARRGDDDVMLQRLKEVLADVEPAPPGLQEVADQLLTWRTVDVELAELLRAPTPATAR